MIDDVVSQARGQKVVKDNRLIQSIVKHKSKLKAQEQKIICYLLSLIKPEDVKKKPPYIYTFDAKMFCMICGIDYTNGGNIKSIKNALDSISDYRFWLDYGEGLLKFQWIATPDIKKNTLNIEVEIPSKIMPYLVGLKNKFTEYELWQVLPLESRYSVALYEYLRSYLYKGEVQVSIEELRTYLGVSENKYTEFRNFKRLCINLPISEINESTDISVEWKGIRRGKSYSDILFTIKKKRSLELYNSYKTAKKKLDGDE